MTNELKKLVENQIEAKKKQALERIEKTLNDDRETIEKAIELIKTHALYKKVGKNNNYIYQLATEEDLKNDYIKEPKLAWKKGIKFHRDEFSERVNKGILEVNGEVYYDIRYALNNYESQIYQITDSLRCLEKEIKEKQKDLELLNKSFPTLKKAIEEWQKYEREGE